MRYVILAAAALAVAAPAAATPASDFHRVMDEEYRWLLRENPTEATALGVRDYDTPGDISPAARDRWARGAGLLTRLNAIPTARLSPAADTARS